MALLASALEVLCVVLCSANEGVLITPRSRKGYSVSAYFAQETALLFFFVLVLNDGEYFREGEKGCGSFCDVERCCFTHGGEVGVVKAEFVVGLCPLKHGFLPELGGIVFCCWFKNSSGKEILRQRPVLGKEAGGEVAGDDACNEESALESFLIGLDGLVDVFA